MPRIPRVLLSIMFLALATSAFAIPNCFAFIVVSSLIQVVAMACGASALTEISPTNFPFAAVSAILFGAIMLAPVILSVIFIDFIREDVFLAFRTLTKSPKSLAVAGSRLSISLLVAGAAYGTIFH